MYRGALSRPQKCLAGLLLSSSAFLSASAQSFDPPLECEAGENLWLVSAGTQGSTPLPEADMRVPSVTFQDYSDGEKTFRTARITGIPAGRIGQAQTLERYVPNGGVLGAFTRRWPTDVYEYDSSKLSALPPRNPPPFGTGLYPSAFATTDLLDGTSTETPTTVVQSPGFKGELTYVVDAATNVDFVAIGLCSAAVPKTVTPVTPNTDVLTQAQIQARIEKVKADAAAAKARAEAETAANAISFASKAAEQSSRAAVKISNELAAELTAYAKETGAALPATIMSTANEAKAAADKAEAAEQSAKNASTAAEAKAAQANALTQLELAQSAANAAAELFRADRRQRASQKTALIQSSEEQLAAIEGQEAQIETQIVSSAAVAPVPLSAGHLAHEETLAAQTRRDMITTGAIAGSALMNFAGQALSSLIRGGASVPTPTPAPSPIPAPPPPTPAPISQAGGGITGRDPKDKNKSSDESKKKLSPASSLRLSQKGVLFPSSPSMVTPFPSGAAALETAYAAVGRVGRAQGYDGEEWLSFGSAVLIAPDKVLTNFHIWWNYLGGNSDFSSEYDPDIGVEFEAREGSSDSDFIPFSEEPCTKLTGMDAVVLTLSRPAARAPIWPQARDYGEDSESLGSPIYCLGYPVRPEDWDSMVENNPGNMMDIFGTLDPQWNIKRWSAGDVIRHSDDVDEDILFDAPVSNRINPYGAAALCHNASSMGGNSGGAILCQETGAFLGLHFGGQRTGSDRVNYSVPGALLLEALNTKGISEWGTHPAPLAEPITNELKTDEPNQSPVVIIDPEITEPEIDEPEIIDPEIIEPENTEPVTPMLPEPDDLTLIEGIGPKTQAALRAGGVGTFRRLSQGSPYDLLPILAEAGLKRRDPTTWPAQAALAAAGDWETLYDWQDLLHGGREVDPN